MASVVDKHPMRATIIEGLLAGKSLRAVGSSVTPPVHHVVLHKYRQKHIRPTMDGAAVLSNALKVLAENNGETAVAISAEQATRAALLADPYRARIAQHQATADRSIVKAEADGDGRTVAALISTDLKGLELDARLTGRLDTHQQAAQQLYIVSPCVNVTIGERPAQPAIDITPSCDRTDA